MFVDASAIVAILTREDEADRFIAALETAEGATTSPVAVFEATLGLSRKRASSIDVALADVREFLQLARIEIVSVGEAEAVLALQAFARFGKGRGHPAQLNMGDCFSYGCAKALGSDLLFKGNDFSATDIQAAKF